MNRIKLKAFSLIELSVALLIIGIILSSIFKGVQLVENAKIQSVAKQFQEIRLNVENYVTRYGEWPGKLSSYDTLEHTKQAFDQLHEKGITTSKSLVHSKFGGVFQFKTIQGKHYLQLVSETGQGLLNEKQILNLKSLIDIADSDLCVMDDKIFSYPLS